VTSNGHAFIPDAAAASQLRRGLFTQSGRQLAPPSRAASANNGRLSGSRHFLALLLLLLPRVAFGNAAGQILVDFFFNKGLGIFTQRNRKRKLAGLKPAYVLSGEGNTFLF
jgi:hypothetical protein